MTLALTVAVAAALAACSAPKTPSLTTDELLADPVMMQTVIDRCDANKTRAATDVECGNMRRAIEIKAAADEVARAADKQKEFERLRAQRREQDDKLQRATESSKPAFDPYSTPVDGDPPGTAPKH
jgi:hypothetical protein